MSAQDEEQRLLEKLRRIEALFAGATTPGEREAAAEARRRVQARLDTAERADPPTEYRFALPDAWSRKVFVALCRRHGLDPYRYRGQRYTTVQVMVSRRFVDETLWPEFQEVSRELRAHIESLTDRIISEAIHQDMSEAAEIAPRQLEDKG